MTLKSGCFSSTRNGGRRSSQLVASRKHVVILQQFELISVNVSTDTQKFEKHFCPVFSTFRAESLADPVFGTGNAKVSPHASKTHQGISTWRKHDGLQMTFKRTI